MFKLQETEMMDPELDYTLMRVCKQMIKVRALEPAPQRLHAHASLQADDTGEGSRARATETTRSHESASR